MFLVLLPTAAFAHPDAGHTADLLHGFAHPFGGADHVAAMLAVGVFAAVLGGRAMWLVPPSFLAAMGVGFWLGLSDVVLPLSELAIAFSGVIIGAAAIWGRAMPVPLAMALVGLFAVFHGVAHGAEMPKESDAVLHALGFIVATALLHGVGLAAALIVTRLKTRRSQRPGESRLSN